MDTKVEDKDIIFSNKSICSIRCNLLEAELEEKTMY